VGGDEDLRRHPERRRDLDNPNKALADLLVEHLVLQVDAYVASIDACHSPRSKS
jgi:Holliday junction resolvase RusA-like endonuclease